MLAVRAVLRCAVLLLPFVLFVYASIEVTKNVLLPERAPKPHEQIIKYELGEKSAQVFILGKAIYHAGRYI